MRSVLALEVTLEMRSPDLPAPPPPEGAALGLPWKSSEEMAVAPWKRPSLALSASLAPCLSSLPKNWLLEMALASLKLLKLPAAPDGELLEADWCPAGDAREALDEEVP